MASDAIDESRFHGLSAGDRDAALKCIEAMPEEAKPPFNIGLARYGKPDLKASLTLSSWEDAVISAIRQYKRLLEKNSIITVYGKGYDFHLDVYDERLGGGGEFDT